MDAVPRARQTGKPHCQRHSPSENMHNATCLLPRCAFEAQRFNSNTPYKQLVHVHDTPLCAPTDQHECCLDQIHLAPNNVTICGGSIVAPGMKPLSGTNVIVCIPQGAANTKDSVLALASAAESSSEHPVGKAVAEAARARGVVKLEPAVEGFQATPGMGVSCTVVGRSAGESCDLILLFACLRTRLAWRAHPRKSLFDTMSLVFRKETFEVVCIMRRMMCVSVRTYIHNDSVDKGCPLILRSETATRLARLNWVCSRDLLEMPLHRAGILPSRVSS